MRGVLRVLLGLLFLSPFLIWLTVIDRWSSPGWDWLLPLLGSFGQATLSATASVLVGTGMAMGSLSLKSPKWLGLLEFWQLIPNLLPQLILILAVLNIAGHVSWLHEGLVGVVFAHVLL